MHTKIKSSLPGAKPPAFAADSRRRRDVLRAGTALFTALLFDQTSCVAAALDAPSAIVDSSFFSPALAENLPYKIYLPPGYAESTKRYPVLYLLHGRGDNFTAWTRIKPLLDELIKSGKIPACLAVMPDAASSQRANYYVDSAYTGGAAPGRKMETALVAELIPQIDAHYRSDVRREARVVGGYSMGGYGALRYALAYPALFGAAIVLSPATYVPLPPVDSSTRTFGGFGRGEALFDDVIYQSKNYPALLAPFAAKNLPLHVFVAAGDDEYKNAAPDEAHDIDMEAHTLYSKLVRTPHITAELRILNGGHNWPVWEPAFREGVVDVFARLGKARRGRNPCAST